MGVTVLVKWQAVELKTFLKKRGLGLVDLTPEVFESILLIPDALLSARIDNRNEIDLVCHAIGVNGLSN